jgi:hypothetical protein
MHWLVSFLFLKKVFMKENSEKFDLQKLQGYEKDILI